MQSSFHNPWQGIVKSIHQGNIVSEVKLEIAPNVSVIAVVSTGSVKTETPGAHMETSDAG